MISLHIDQIKKKYQQVQHQLNTDQSLEHWLHRQEKCEEIYAQIVKDEPAIMEWEVDYWGRYGKWGLPFFMFFFIAFIPLLFMYVGLRDHELVYQLLLFGFFLIPFPVIVMTLGAECFPTRYYQKITASGFYSYGVKVGSERRKDMAKYCMMAGFVIAVILLFVAGPLVFVGAGAASLSFLKLGTIPEPKPEESAWSWLGIYCFVVTKPVLYTQYKVSTHGNNDLILTAEQLAQVKLLIQEYGQHELDLVEKKKGVFYSRWWDHQETMPFRHYNNPR
ncbi:hypothetical protein [Photobacterium galatheae]|uniref:Uncharacterized protein n=1 Tax=Photobacterium galatheae TaxID=1654360 RepID=A0A066RQ14_9GAMM|nr:hypothetical protein [Photobacterium galatheae]KDM89762.1 hypothetical protein EA58_20110 [Photobacterium galatheae]MCM0151414.1 hypothetical protein [Photobacterium galatheae]